MYFNSGATCLDSALRCENACASSFAAKDMVSAEMSKNRLSYGFLTSSFCVSIISTYRLQDYVKLLSKRQSLRNFAVLLAMVTSFVHAVWQGNTTNICKRHSLVKFSRCYSRYYRNLKSFSRMIHDAWRQKFYFRKNKNFLLLNKWKVSHRGITFLLPFNRSISCALEMCA